jgi:hypothetical protein
MSNATAIAATTSTLRNLLLAQIPARDASLADLEVTTLPPDLARKGITKAQLNLFLYQTAVNAAWRNLDVPGRVRPGESPNPPLALDLHYLLTAYGRETDDETVSHRVLGGAMSVLHDHPLLGRDEIRTALPDSGLGDQFERLRITPLAMPLDDMSKLWTALQAPYRVSASYQATVVLIDSLDAGRAPLPVLRRGDDARGPVAVAATAPVLDSVRYPHGQPAARLGDTVAIVGTRLGVAGATLHLRSTHPAVPLDVLQTPVAGDRPGEIGLQLVDDAAALSRWAPGRYALTLTLQPPPGQPALPSTPIAFALAPTITVSPTAAAPGALALVVQCAPRIAAGQDVRLLFGEQAFTPDSIDTPVDTTQPTSLHFALPAVAAGTYVVRLRVDGVDSLPVDYAGPVPTFDPAQQVVVA